MTSEAVFSSIIFLSFQHNSGKICQLWLCREIMRGTGRKDRQTLRRKIKVESWGWDWQSQRSHNPSWCIDIIWHVTLCVYVCVNPDTLQTESEGLKLRGKQTLDTLVCWLHTGLNYGQKTVTEHWTTYFIKTKYDKFCLFSETIATVPVKTLFISPHWDMLD